MVARVRRQATITDVTFSLIPVLGAVQHLAAPFDRSAQRASLLVAIGRLFDEPYEHVAVLWEGGRRDMFVGESSAENGRHIRNIRATEIYRNNWLTQHPGTDPESLPAISGPAVLFDQIVWF